MGKHGLLNRSNSGGAGGTQLVHQASKCHADGSFRLAASVLCAQEEGPQLWNGNQALDHRVRVAPVPQVVQPHGCLQKYTLSGRQTLASSSLCRAPACRSMVKS